MNIHTNVKSFDETRRSLAQLAGGMESARIAYTPTWLASGPDPVLGNATLTGYYSFTDRRCYTSILAQIGNSTNFTTGTEWAWALPLDCIGEMDILGSAIVFDYSTSTTYTGNCRIRMVEDRDWIISVAMNGLAGYLGRLVFPAAMGAWSAGDRVLMTIDYPI